MDVEIFQIDVVQLSGIRAENADTARNGGSRMFISNLEIVYFDVL